MGDQSKELNLEETQLWWEINDSDIVTVPEKRECDTTVPQQQPLLNTANEVEGSPGTPVNAFNAAGFPTTSSESQPDLDIPTYDMMLTMAVDVKNLVLNTKETNHYNVEMINKINNCLERFTPAVKTQAEIDKSDYIALERKYTEEKASWEHTEELLRNIIRKKAKMEQWESLGPAKPYTTSQDTPVKPMPRYTASQNQDTPKEFDGNAENEMDTDTWNYNLSAADRITSHKKRNKSDLGTCFMIEKNGINWVYILYDKMFFEINLRDCSGNLQIQLIKSMRSGRVTPKIKKLWSASNVPAKRIEEKSFIHAKQHGIQPSEPWCAEEIRYLLTKGNNPYLEIIVSPCEVIRNNKICH